VNVGLIGLGFRGYGVANEGKEVKGFRVVAACDCYRPRLDGFLKDFSPGGKLAAYEDFRRMIEKEKLDAVMVETPTHARAWIVVQALQAGMDAYIEKPMCLTIAEGRAMVQAARKYNRVTQVGTQQRSMPMNNWASDLVRNGAIGKVLAVIAPNFVGPFRWTKTSSADLKSSVDAWWDVWTNQAELRSYDDQIRRDWGRWWDYDGGGLSFGVTGWGTHSYDQVNRALGTDATGPLEVRLEEPVAMRDSGRFAPQKTVGGVVIGETGDIDTGTEYRAKLNGPRAKVTMKFAGGTELKLHLDGDRGPGLGAIFVGEKGRIEINRNKLASNPKEIVRSPDNPGRNKRPETAYHIENWIECIKSRKPCNADIEIGQRATTLCYLVNIAREVGRVGETLRWDPVAERFTNCAEGNRLLSRPRRKGYELPEIA
jgi:predicted dehydrogenase